MSHGDPPLSIAWLKDGAPVLLQDGEDPSAAVATAAAATFGNGGGGDGAVVVTTLDPYSSLLSIPRLTRHHTGRYTCQAQNPAAQVRYTAALLVKGKCTRRENPMLRRRPLITHQLPSHPLPRVTAVVSSEQPHSTRAKHPQTKHSHVRPIFKPSRHTTRDRNMLCYNEIRVVVLSSASKFKLKNTYT